jgi:hypothetical protein
MPRTMRKSRVMCCKVKLLRPYKRSLKGLEKGRWDGGWVSSHSTEVRFLNLSSVFFYFWHLSLDRCWPLFGEVKTPTVIRSRTVIPMIYWEVPLQWSMMSLDMCGWYIVDLNNLAILVSTRRIQVQKTFPQKSSDDITHTPTRAIRHPLSQKECHSRNFRTDY